MRKPYSQHPETEHIYPLPSPRVLRLPITTRNIVTLPPEENRTEGGRREEEDQRFISVGRRRGGERCWSLQ